MQRKWTDSCERMITRHFKLRTHRNDCHIDTLLTFSIWVQDSISFVTSNWVFIIVADKSWCEAEWKRSLSVCESTESVSARRMSERIILNHVIWLMIHFQMCLWRAATQEQNFISFIHVTINGLIWSFLSSRLHRHRFRLPFAWESVFGHLSRNALCGQGTAQMNRRRRRWWWWRRQSA